MADEIFHRVVELCGFSEVLGPGIVRRALLDEGADPDAIQIDDYRRALPRLERRMQAYMSAHEASARSRRVRAYLRRRDDGAHSDDSGEWSNFGRSVEILRQAKDETSGERELPFSTPPPRMTGRSTLPPRIGDSGAPEASPMLDAASRISEPLRRGNRDEDETSGEVDLPRTRPVRERTQSGAVSKSGEGETAPPQRSVAETLADGPLSAMRAWLKGSKP